MVILAERAHMCSYEIDRSLNLAGVDEGWSQFAAANDAPQLLPPLPIGQPILASIGDPTTKYLYAELFKQLVIARRPVTLAIRCDSPAVRRYLDLTIVSHGAGFTVTTRLVRSEPNPGGYVLAADAARDPEQMIRVCSWCKRIDVAGEWFELDIGLPRLGLFEGSVVPAITHGMCDPCHQRVLTTIAGL